MSKKQMGMKSVLAASVIAALSGCATNGMKVVEESHETQKAQADELLEKSFVKIQQRPLISKADTFWVDRTPLPQRIDPASQLPPVFGRYVELNEQASLPLSEVFVRLTKLPTMSGIKFSVAQDVYESDPSRLGLNVGAANAAANSGTADSTTAKPGTAPAGAASTGSSGSQSRRVDVMVSDLIFKGSFAELLDQIATKTNLAWRFDGEKVHFFRYDSRIFRIDALAGALTTSSTISSTGTGSGSSSSSSTGPTNSSNSTSSTSLNLKSDLWADVSSALQAQLSPRGKMSLMPSTGQVTITDTPDQLRRIDHYIKDLNASLGKQIAFNVHVYSVQSNIADGYGIDWTAVWSTIASKYNLGFQTAGNTTSLGNLFSVNLINSSSGERSNFAGSKAILGALSTLGKTSLVTSTSVVTLNNVPAPISVTTETGYLQSISTTVSGTSGTSQTSLTPGTITAGFNMNLLPRVGDGDDLMVQFSMDLSDLVKLTTFNSPDGKSAIQLPQTNLRNFLQRVSMHSGETLILSGFQQTAAQNDMNGIGSPSFWALGGSKNTSGTTTTLVIMITPYVMAK